MIPPWGWLVQYQLIGRDPDWRAVNGQMATTARLFDADGREIGSRSVAVYGQNLGWPAVQTRSNLMRKIEPLSVPAGARSLEISFDSGTRVAFHWPLPELAV